MHKKNIALALLIIGMLSVEPTMHAMDNSSNWRKNIPFYNIFSPDNACEPACEFVRTTLKEHGIEQSVIDKIKIKKGNCWASKSNTLFLNDTLLNEFLSLKDGDSLTTLMIYGNNTQFIMRSKNEYLNVSKMSVLHEYGHLLNKDCSKNIFTAFAMYIPIMYLLEKPINLLIAQQPLVQKFKFPLHIAATGAILIPLFGAYRKYREYKADMISINLCQDTSMLESTAEDYLSIYEFIERPQVKTFYEKQYKNNIAFRELCYWFNNMRDDHPSSLTRANYFNAAAESLKAKQLAEKNEAKKE